MDRSSRRSPVSTVMGPTRCRSTHSTYCFARSRASLGPEISRRCPPPDSSLRSRRAPLTRDTLALVAPPVPTRNAASSPPMVICSVSPPLSPPLPPPPPPPPPPRSSSRRRSLSRRGERERSRRSRLRLRLRLRLRDAFLLLLSRLSRLTDRLLLLLLLRAAGRRRSLSSSSSFFASSFAFTFSSSLTSSLTATSSSSISWSTSSSLPPMIAGTRRRRGARLCGIKCEKRQSECYPFQPPVTDE
mmetsp:Transcript_17595/g.43471  ORF Transcript_17595/g.43471 Transcript_17595/m.43471 type:complete len:244 (+) Transcript_17595:1413-2144(+)